MVPDGWKIAAFDELGISVIDGDRGRSYPKKDDYLNDGYCLFLGAENIINGELNLNKKVFLSKEKYEAMRKGVVKHDDILLVMRGNGTGRVCLFDSKKANSRATRINSGLVIIRLDQNRSDVRYMLQLFQSMIILKQFESFMFGSAQPQLTIQILKSIVFPTPTIEEQTKIAQTLSTWDRAIATTEQLLNNSCQQKKALMQQLLTGKKRFSGFEGEWKDVNLAQLATVIMGSSPKSESYNEDENGLPLLQGNADIKNRKSVPRVFTSTITKECLRGDILLSVRAPVGQIATSEHNACIGRGFSAIRVNNGASQAYLYQWLLWFEARWVRFSQGSTFDSVNRDDIKGLTVNLPATLLEQQKIVSVLSAADSEIEALQQELDDLKQEKKALMQQLLTGKRRVGISDQLH